MVLYVLTVLNRFKMSINSKGSSPWTVYNTRSRVMYVASRCSYFLCYISTSDDDGHVLKRVINISRWPNRVVVVGSDHSVSSSRRSSNENLRPASREIRLSSAAVAC